MRVIALARENDSLATLYLSPRGRVRRKVFWLHGVLALVLAYLLGQRPAEHRGRAQRSSPAPP